MKRVLVVLEVPDDEADKHHLELSSANEDDQFGALKELFSGEHPMGILVLPSCESEPSAEPVRNAGDVLNRVIGLVSSMPLGLEQPASIEIGELARISSIQFDKYEPATEECDADGSDQLVFYTEI